MFGRKAKELVMEEVAYLKGPPQKVWKAKASYTPSHAGTIAIEKGEVVSNMGPAPGANGKDWTKVRTSAQVEGFVPTSFLSSSAGPPQLLIGRLQITKGDVIFEGEHGGLAGLVIKAQIPAVIQANVDQAAPDIVRGSGVLKTVRLSYHEKGPNKGEKRDIELLLVDAVAQQVGNRIQYAIVYGSGSIWLVNITGADGTHRRCANKFQSCRSSVRPSGRLRGPIGKTLSRQEQRVPRSTSPAAFMRPKRNWTISKISALQKLTETRGAARRSRSGTASRAWAETRALC
jgi:hypothetical protein